jgi:PPOX class probable F420-dependent enzyme
MVQLTEEQRHFLLDENKTGKLATVRTDGRPHIVPVWFHLDGDEIVFNTGEKTVKAANMRRDPRISLCVDDERPPFSYIQIEGEATWSNDLAEVKRWATLIGGRYMGEDRAESYGNRNGVPGELLVRVRPTKIRFEKDIAG